MPKRGPCSGLPCPWQSPDDVSFPHSQLRASAGPAIWWFTFRSAAQETSGSRLLPVPGVDSAQQCPRHDARSTVPTSQLPSGATVQVLAEQDQADVPRETLAVIMEHPQSHDS